MTASFLPSHAAPDGGLPAWGRPDPTQPIVATIDARVEMQVMERQRDWARIVCSNGWSAWVDARRLVSLHAPPPVTASAAATPGPPPSSASRQVDPAGLAGAALVALASVLPWLSIEGVPSANSFKVPLLYLVQLKPGATDLKLGMLLLVAAAAIAIPGRRSLRQGAAGAVIGVCCLYLIQLQRQLSQATDAPSIASVAGIGVLAAAAGAALALLWKPGKATLSG